MTPIRNESIKKAINVHTDLFNHFMNDEVLIRNLEKAAQSIAHAIHLGNKIIICGNGGSCADSAHFAAELTGKFRKLRPAFSCIPLTDPCHITCVGNDFGFEEIFARGVEAYGDHADVLIAISTSGKSPNILRAIETADIKNMKTILLTGKKPEAKADHILAVVPDNYGEVTTDRIQEIHEMILHIIVDIVESIITPGMY